MNSLEEVSRDEFSEFVRKHKNLDSKPYESSSVCSMMYIDENMGGMTIAQAIYYKGGKPVYKIRKDYKQSEDNKMLNDNFEKVKDEYGKEAISLILQRRDGMSKEDAEGLIKDFESELADMVKEDYNKDKGFTYSLYDIEENFADTFGLEPDYLFCFLNDILAKEKN